MHVDAGGHISAPPAADDLDAFRPRLAHLRYLRGWLELLETGSVTTTALAKKLGRSRQALHGLRRRTPLLDAWVARQLAHAHADQAERVIARMGALALKKGSTFHADLFLRAIGRLGPSSSAGGGPAVAINIVSVPLPGNPLAPLSRLPDAQPRRG